MFQVKSKVLVVTDNAIAALCAVGAGYLYGDAIRLLFSRHFFWSDYCE